MLKSNGYPSATISNILEKTSTPEIIPSPEELVGMFFRLIDPPDSQNGLQFYHISKGSLNHLQEFLTRTVSEPPPDRSRPYNRNLCLLNLDPHQIGKRTLSIKSPVRTAHGVTLEKRADVYTLEKRNIFETPKFLKVAPTLPAMRGSKAILLILRMHVSSTEAIHA